MDSRWDQGQWRLNVKVPETRPRISQADIQVAMFSASKGCQLFIFDLNSLFTNEPVGASNADSVGLAQRGLAGGLV
jgi:hypothetical protein